MKDKNVAQTNSLCDKCGEVTRAEEAAEDGNVRLMHSGAILTREEIMWYLGCPEEFGQYKELVLNRALQLTDYAVNDFIENKLPALLEMAREGYIDGNPSGTFRKWDHYLEEIVQKAKEGLRRSL